MAAELDTFSGAPIVPGQEEKKGKVAPKGNLPHGKRPARPVAAPKKPKARVR